MNGPKDERLRKGLRAWWASPQRSGMRRIISPPEYRHLRGSAAFRIVGAIISAGLGAFIVSAVSNAWVILGIVLLANAAANVLFAIWELDIVRSESAQADPGTHLASSSASR